MGAYRRLAWKRHVPNDADLAPEHKQRQQGVESPVTVGAGMESSRFTVAGGDDFSQLLQADAMRVRGDDFDDFASVDGGGGFHGWLGNDTWWGG